MTEPLIQGLQNQALYSHPVEKFEVIETHLSWVLLTGKWAYKIKKPVNLGFQDFSTLEKRKQYCEQELLLNKRLAPEVYEEVVGITGTRSAPSFSQAGEPIEYAVKMKQFSQENVLHHAINQDHLTYPVIEKIAHILANFHHHAQICPQAEPYGSSQDVILPIQDNFSALRALPIRPAQRAQIANIETSTFAQFEQLKTLIDSRKSSNKVKACHGDLHLGNMVMIDDAPVIFDCIEFNERFRWTDVINDIAFFTMDLMQHHRHDLSDLFLDRYLSITFDYEGLRLLRFYQCYRAMVRAKVCAFQLQLELSSEQRDLLEKELQNFLDLASHYLAPCHPTLAITMGVSGSGKSYYSEKYFIKHHAIRLRSDEFRLRLFPQPAERYSSDATHTVYHALASTAQSLLQAGFSVVVDAACLQHWQRDLLHQVALEHRVPFSILQCEAPLETLITRIEKRQISRNDPSEATIDVAKQQLKEQEPLTEAEKEFIIRQE